MTRDPLYYPTYPPPPLVRPPVFERAISPVDLWGKFDAPTLPWGLLPPVIEQLAFIMGEHMGADPAGIAVSALTVCAAAIPDGIRLQVKHHDSQWCESARVWAMHVGLPSTKKTPILSLAVKPLINIEKSADTVFRRQYAAWSALSKEEKETTPEPRPKRHLIRDTTMEASQEVFRYNSNGILVLQDELSGWFGAMEKYGSKGASADRAYWLQSYNGGHYSVDRISRGSFSIDNLSCSILGGIQPDRIRDIASSSSDDGLLQRFIPIILRPATQSVDQVVPAVREVYNFTILMINQLKLGPSPLRFDEKAQCVRDQMERRHLDLQKVELVSTKLGAHFGKYDGLFARLCLIWHAIENAHSGSLPAIIPYNVAQRVSRFMQEFLLPHATSFYGTVLGLGHEQELIYQLANHILAKKWDSVDFRVVKSGIRPFRNLDKWQFYGVCDQLEGFGWLLDSSGKSKNSRRWTVNPQVHIQFATRAAMEAKKLEEGRQIITELFGRH